MCYGEADFSLLGNHWYGEPVPNVPEGKILKRQRNVNTQNNNIIKYLDSDTAHDWLAPRLYGIGQSDFYPQTFDFTGKVIPFISPENSLSTIISEVKNASNYISLNAYEFTHPILAESLSEALDRGVSVRILMEGNPVGWNFSNINDPEYEKTDEYTQKYLLYQLHQAGAKIKFLSNFKNDNKNSNIFKRYNYNHAKYALIDGEKCIIMSGNWKPTSVPIDITFGNREWGVVIYNSEVSDYFNAVFESDWWPSSEIQNDTHYFDLDSNFYGAPPGFFELNFTVPIGWYDPIESLATNAPLQPIQDSFKIEPVISPDTASRTDSAIIGLINNAKSSVYIQQMDCNLDWILTRTSSKKLSINWSDSENYYLNWADGNQYYNEYLKASIDAARRGCVVKILLDSRYVEPDIGPGKVNEGSIEDNLDTIQYINHIASLEGLTDNLQARLNYLSGLEKVHNKGIIVDGQKVLISSINWNYNSVSNNREVGAIIDNAQVAEFYAEIFNQDWLKSITTNKPTLPNASEAAILITEVYANTYLNYEPDEYIAISNPTNDTVDIGGWSINDKLTTYGGYEGYLVFPMGSIIKPHEKLYITRTGQAFYDVHDFLPNFEFFEDSRWDVPQMEIIDSSSSTNRGPRFANKGDEVVLSDEYLFSDFGLESHHIIDMVIYGNSTYISDFHNISYPYNTTHWHGPSIYNISQGEVLKRNRLEFPIEQKRKFTEFYDSNSATDWETDRVYYPGQSGFTSNIIDYTGSLTVFSSPDSSYQVISDELDKAKISICMSVYQFHNPYLMDKMVNASMRGVDVKVLLDGAPVGGITDAARFVAQELVRSGCEVRYLRSVAAEDIYRRYRFIHAKYTVIDDFTTIIISENWKTTGVPVDNTAGNRGWGVVLRNQDVANSYSQVFFHDWDPGIKDSYAFNSSDPKYGAPPEDFVMSWAVFGGNYKPRFESKTINGAFKVMPVIAPDTTLNNYGSILEMINSATTSVCIEQMDCYIDWDTKGRDIENLYLSAAIDAARRGCDVKILLDSAFVNPSDPGLDNYDTVQYINSIAYNENLTDKLQAKLIFLNGMAGRNEMSKVHNKGLIVDGTKTLVSSINWVTGSVIYNREVGVIIENEKVAQFYTKIFNYDWNLTVQELIEVYVLHSDTHDILPGEATEYIINFVNMQTIELHVNLTLTGLLPGWNATLDMDNFVLAPTASNISEPKEIRLTVAAPTQGFLEALKNSSDPSSKYALFGTQELGIHAEVSGMAADIVFTTTTLMDESKEDNGGSSNPDQPLDRSMVNPWLVVILLVILLISGAILRDVVHSRLEKKRKSSRTNGETEAEDIKEENQKEIESDYDETEE
jgi:phosphatidylserine/phosphatidylglycerophosphate/cardiolipin synthase-like enzyme